MNYLNYSAFVFFSSFLLRCAGDRSLIPSETTSSFNAEWWCCGAAGAIWCLTSASTCFIRLFLSPVMDLLCRKKAAVIIFAYYSSCSGDESGRLSSKEESYRWWKVTVNLLNWSYIFCILLEYFYFSGAGSDELHVTNK